MSDTPKKQYVDTDRTLLNAEHVKRYRETNGAVGYIWNGVPTLLLTTTGNKSGQPRTTPLIYAADNDCYVVVASKGGSSADPNWYRNICKTPEVLIQVKDRVMHATAVTVEGRERDRLWTLVTDQWPNYDLYAARTARVIPVVRLAPHTSRAVD